MRSIWSPKPHILWFEIFTQNSRMLITICSTKVTVFPMSSSHSRDSWGFWDPPCQVSMIGEATSTGPANHHLSSYEIMLELKHVESPFFAKLKRFRIANSNAISCKLQCLEKSFLKRQQPQNCTILCTCTLSDCRKYCHVRWAVFKIPVAFHYTSWFTGIPLLDYDNPQYIGQSNL